MAATKIAASTGVSAARNGRKAGLGKACPIASKCSEQFWCQHYGCRYDGPFDRDIIAPVSWKRRVGFRHRAISPFFPSPLAGEGGVERNLRSLNSNQSLRSASVMRERNPRATP